MALTQVKALGLAADSIDETKLADNSIDSEHYNDGSIDHEHLADDAVDGDIIADNAVGLAHMAAGTDGVIITYDASGDPVHVGPGTDGQVLTSTGAGSPPAFEDASSDTLSFRRINHNGDCSVAQRGTITGLTSGYGGPDRYKLYAASHGTYTASQELDAPDGFDQSLKILNTAADTSIASSARLHVQHRIEKYDLIRTKKGTSGALSLTAQFWVKSDKTGTYIFEMWDNQNNRHISSTYAISSADTWEKKTMTFAGDTTGDAFAAANTSGIDCNWWLAAGSNFTSGSLATSWTANTDTNRCVGQTVNIGDSGNWYMTGFQLETGSTATDFEYRSYGDELARCRRYFQNWDCEGYFAAGGATSAGASIVPCHYATEEMRATPTVTLPNTTSSTSSGEIRHSNHTGSTPATAGTIGVNSISKCGFNVSGTSFASSFGAAGNTVYLYTDSCQIKIDAEL